MNTCHSTLLDVLLALGQAKISDPWPVLVCSVELKRDPAMQVQHVIRAGGITWTKTMEGKMAEQCSCPVNAELCP